MHPPSKYQDRFTHNVGIVNTGTVLWVWIHLLLLYFSLLQILKLLIHIVTVITSITPILITNIITLTVWGTLWPKGRKINLSLNYRNRNYNRINYMTHFLLRLAFGEISFESVDIWIAFEKRPAEQLRCRWQMGTAVYHIIVLYPGEVF